MPDTTNDRQVLIAMANHARAISGLMLLVALDKPQDSDLTSGEVVILSTLSRHCTSLAAQIGQLSRIWRGAKLSKLEKGMKLEDQVELFFAELPIEMGLVLRQYFDLLKKNSEFRDDDSLVFDMVQQYLDGSALTGTCGQTDDYDDGLI